MRCSATRATRGRGSGAGYFVCFRRDGVLAPYSAVGEGVLVHTLQKHPAEGGVVFPFSVLAKTMRRVISEYGEEILDKSPNCGCDELRSAISRYLLRSRGIKAEVEQIVIGSGAEYLYGLCVGLLGRDRVYAIESPSYEKIEKVYLASEVEYEKLPMGADGIDSRALEATAARVLHISPYRSFPSRISASASKRHEYLRWAEKRGGIIIEDDFESEFSVSAKPEETLFGVMRRRKGHLYEHVFKDGFAGGEDGVHGTAAASREALSGKAGVLFLHRSYVRAARPRFADFGRGFRTSYQPCAPP